MSEHMVMENIIRKRRSETLQNSRKVLKYLERNLAEEWTLLKKVWITIRYKNNMVWNPKNFDDFLKTLINVPDFNARVRFSCRLLSTNRADFLKTLQISLYFLKTS